MTSMIDKRKCESNLAQSVYIIPLGTLDLPHFTSYTYKPRSSSLPYPTPHPPNSWQQPSLSHSHADLFRNSLSLNDGSSKNLLYNLKKSCVFFFVRLSRLFLLMLFWGVFNGECTGQRAENRKAELLLFPLPFPFFLLPPPRFHSIPLKKKTPFLTHNPNIKLPHKSKNLRIPYPHNFYTSNFSTTLPSSVFLGNNGLFDIENDGDRRLESVGISFLVLGLFAGGDGGSG